MYPTPSPTRVLAPLWPELELARQLRARTLPGETAAERRARRDAARDIATHPATRPAEGDLR